MREFRISKAAGFRISHPYRVTDPNCEDAPHSTRDCRCKVFKTLQTAEQYVEEQS